MQQQTPGMLLNYSYPDSPAVRTVPSIQASGSKVQSVSGSGRRVLSSTCEIITNSHTAIIGVHYHLNSTVLPLKKMPSLFCLLSALVYLKHNDYS